MKIHPLETTLGTMTLDQLFSVFRNLEAKKKKKKGKNVTAQQVQIKLLEKEDPTQESLTHLGDCCHRVMNEELKFVTIAHQMFLIALRERFEKIYCCFPGGSDKELTCQCRRQKKSRFDLWVGKIPWKRKWQSTPVFLPEKSHGHRCLVGQSMGSQRVRHD